MLIELLLLDETQRNIECELRARWLDVLSVQDCHLNITPKVAWIFGCAKALQDELKGTLKHAGLDKNKECAISEFLVLWMCLTRGHV